MTKVLERIKSALRGDIVKVLSLTSVSTLVKMCTGLVSIKVVALLIGPAGVALVGQLNNFVSIILSFAGGGIDKGITRYTSEHKYNPELLSAYLSTALKITVVFSVVIGILLIIFSSWLSKTVLLSKEYGYVFILFGTTLLMYAANNFLLCVVNGFKEFKRFVSINIASSLTGLAFTLTLVALYGTAGALAAMVTFQSVVLAITLWIVRRAAWMKIGNFCQRFSSAIAGKYFRYSLMALISALMLPLSRMLVRGYIMTTVSEDAAGWWEGMCRISNIYLMVITTSFSIYYLPRLSELKSAVEMRAEIIKAIKLIMPLLGTGLGLIYLTRHFIVHLLFSEAFEPMAGLFIWQLGGDFLKIGSWLVAFVMIAKAYTRLYIITEILSTAIYAGASYALIYFHGVTGACEAYFVQYVLYSIAISLIFHKLLFFPHRMTL